MPLSNHPTDKLARYVDSMGHNLGANIATGQRCTDADCVFIDLCARGNTTECKMTTTISDEEEMARLAAGDDILYSRLFGKKP